LALLFGGVGQAKADTITTVPQWNGSDFVFPFGTPDTTTYGQTITATATNNVLNDFTFYLSPRSGSAPTFQAYVAAWNGSAITGSVLYTSGNFTGPTAGGFTAYTFNTGGLNLTVGKQYALFISIAGANYTGITAADNLGAIFTNPYSGGAYIYENNSGNFNALFNPWDQPGNKSGVFGDGYDLAFTADFGAASAIPEPATLVLLGTAAITFAGCSLRRRKRSVER
jgi:hypothetical protein